MDLRHLALILDAGAQKAREMEDAALHASLSAMTEMAVHYALHPDGGSPFSLRRDFADLADRYQ
jgi:hypothetical protein